MLKVRRLLSIGISVALLISVGWVIINHQDLIDRYKVFNYQPSSDILALADNSSMSKSGKFYFYLADPVIEGSDDFNASCQRAEQSNPILGCYKPDIDRIFIYDIDNPELEGAKEVTASHEMLHVAYSRLDSSQKTGLDDLLEEAYAKVKTPDLEERIAYYEESQPGSRFNELHSILGTEFSGLGQELEEYYSEYFNDRSVVFGLYGQYSQKFKDITDESDRLNQELSSLKSEIDIQSANYTSELESLNILIDAFNVKATSGQFNNQQELSREREQLLIKQHSISQARQEIIEQIDLYNQKVERLNELGWHLNQLNDSLDSMGVLE